MLDPQFSVVVAERQTVQNIVVALADGHGLHNRALRFHRFFRGQLFRGQLRWDFLRHNVVELGLEGSPPLQLGLGLQGGRDLGRRSLGNGLNWSN
jgi:hypothetical protein